MLARQARYIRIALIDSGQCLAMLRRQSLNITIALIQSHQRGAVRSAYLRQLQPALGDRISKIPQCLLPGIGRIYFALQGGNIDVTGIGAG